MTFEITTRGAGLALAGGLIIGFSAMMLLLFNGRVAGISGIAHRVIDLKASDRAWRIAFILGLVCGGYNLLRLNPDYFTHTPSFPFWRLALAGILVGYGTALGKGCTSGHGICGISRLSTRSITATLSFMLAGFATVYFLRLFGVVL